MSIKYEFNAKDPSWYMNIDDLFEITIVSGDTGKVIERDSMEDVLKPESIEYDTESNKVFIRTNRLSLIQGKVQTTSYWNDNITETDVERMLVLNANDKVKNGDFTESTLAESVANNKYIFTYKFGADYDVISPNSNRYLLATNQKIEALEDDTRLFCLLAKDNNFDIDVLDISVGETKTINQDYSSNSTKYIFFTQNCTVGEIAINQYSCKKFTSNSIEVQNTSDKILRIFLISR
jgi:hypothetical protein|tara:strand:- start:1945 stop:2652 length:708 start_codon:yes stop_codon:yes gene_type:complete